MCSHWKKLWSPSKSYHGMNCPHLITCPQPLTDIWALSLELLVGWSKCLFGLGLKWLKVTLRFPVFFFSHAWTVQETKNIVHVILHTVHGSHNTIHTFKNYFVTVFSVFSFNNNKFNPNRPQVIFDGLG